MVRDTQWLAERRHGIGGSDAAAIVGLNPYVTPYALWADKTGRLPEPEDNEAMRQGRDLEEYVAQRFCEATGKKVRRHNGFIRNPAYPFAHANIDRAVISEKAGLECKTTTALNLKKFKNGDYPEQYYVQCVHYMAVTGYTKWYLAVLVFGSDFFIFEIERDEDEIRALMDAEKSFWDEHVATDVPPPMDGNPVTTQCLNAIYCASSPTCVDLYDCYEDALIIRDTQAQIKKLREIAELSRQRMKAALGEHEMGSCGPYEILWKAYKRTYISLKALRKKYPKIDLSTIMTCKTYRRFQIKGDAECN